jgi:hypothetical protein
MRALWLATVLLVMGSPAPAQTIRDKVASLTSGPRVMLSQAGIDPVNPNTAYLEWDFDSTEMVSDATQPCIPSCQPILVTPTPAVAAAMTYRLRSTAAPNVAFTGIRIIQGVTCDFTSCRTPPLSTYIPELRQGGSWAITLSRALPPRVLESASTDPVTFTTLNGGGPPPPPPLATCDFVALNTTLLQHFQVGHVLHAVGTLTPGQAGRWLQLSQWHWKLTILPLVNNRFDITAVCMEPA